MRSLTILVGAVIIGTYIGGRSLLSSGRLHDLLILTASLAVSFVIVIVASIRSARRRQQSAVASFALTVDDDGISRVFAGVPDMRLLRSEICRIRERTGQGFRIETKQSSRAIWVPCEIEGYEELLRDLRAITPAELATNRYPFLQTYAVALLMIFAYILTAVSQNKAVVVIAGTFIVALLLWSVWWIQRNPNVTRKTKRAMWVALLPALAEITRIWQLLS